MKKVAIVIGHTSDSKGACSPHGIPCEFDYNSMVANMLSDVADIYTHDTYKFGYTAMVKKTAAKLNLYKYNLVLFLHYNSATSTATGCEVLYYFKSVKGPAYATLLSKEISEKLGVRNRGAKPLSPNDRGYGEVYYPVAPAIIVEPFFGSNKADVDKFKNPSKYVETLKSFILAVT